ncbi:hypothetical protein [Anaerophaga thermohalophila]|uniref:hypothetical protein n=1 Tax=Anaerophaga thermohalophila TaxID=177400 RepID=UPI000314B0FA|nr:hypothetical protein [Anaerophaga thermohalophila]
MDLNELQTIWQQYDTDLKENTRINKEILKQVLLAKPEKRMSREKIKAGINLLLPIILVLLVLIPNVQVRATIEFYSGALLFGIVSSTIYYWSVKYYLLIGKMDFSESLTSIKKKVKQIKKYKIKLKKVSYILMIPGIVGIFLMGGFPLFSTSSVFPVTLIVLVMLFSVYLTFRYSVGEHFRKLNQEIEALEKLEK